jgi:hypothetical protein
MGDDARELRSGSASLAGRSARSPASRREPMMSLVGLAATPAGSTFPAYYAVIPQRRNPAGAAESEGSPPSLAADGDRVIVAFLDRAPSAGEPVVATYHMPSGRWVARRKQAGGSVITGGGQIPLCFCHSLPATIQMFSADHEINYRMFQDCTLVFGPPPSWADPLHLGPYIYLSTASFVDPIAGGASYYYHLNCQFNLFALTRLYPESPFGPAYRDGILYTWLAGGPGNTCDPFQLTNGVAFPGSDGPVSVQLFG